MKDFDIKIDLALSSLEELENESRRIERLNTFKPKSLIWTLFFGLTPIIIIVIRVSKRKKKKQKSLEILDKTIYFNKK